MKTIFDNDFDHNFDDEYESLRDVEKSGISKVFLRAFLEDQMNRDAGKVAPDTIGVDKHFIDGFFTGDMNYDFWVIARDFMEHHFADMPEFAKLSSYMNGASYLSSPEEALRIRIFSVIYKAAKAGDAYSVSLIKNLYKSRICIKPIISGSISS